MQLLGYFVSSLHFKRSPRRGDLVGPLNAYAVDLTFKHNYAHLSHSSACHFVSYQPSISRAARADGGLIFLSTAFASTPFQRNLLARRWQQQGWRGGVIGELSTRSEVTCQGHSSRRGSAGCRGENALLCEQPVARRKHAAAAVGACTHAP